MGTQKYCTSGGIYSPNQITIYIANDLNLTI